LSNNTKFYKAASNKNPWILIRNYINGSLSIQNLEQDAAAAGRKLVGWKYEG
jgi:hypothetical protein